MSHSILHLLLRSLAGSTLPLGDLTLSLSLSLSGQVLSALLVLLLGALALQALSLCFLLELLHATLFILLSTTRVRAVIYHL